MLEALRAARAALAEHEQQCTERWEKADTYLEQAKIAEYVTRCDMQDAAGVRESLNIYITALEEKGQP